MDDPALDERAHHEALRGLARLNRLSMSDRIVFRGIRELGPSPDAGAWSVLDVATGSGDVPVSLGRRAERAGVRLSIRACDASARAVEAARARAQRADAPVDFFVADALDTEPLPHADIVTCSLFLHHLENADAARLLRRMAASARRLLLVSDLRRCRRGMALARLVPRLVTRSPVVHADAVRSVKAAFTMEELGRLARDAGLEGASITPRFPARMLLAWRPDP